MIVRFAELAWANGLRNNTAIGSMLVKVQQWAGPCILGTAFRRIRAVPDRCGDEPQDHGRSKGSWQPSKTPEASKNEPCEFGK